MKLVKETLPIVGVPYVEMLAAMARYSPFAEHAGMQRVNLPQGNDKSYQRALDRLVELGFNLDLLASRKRNLAILERLNVNQLEEVKRIILREFIANKFKRPSLGSKISEGNLESMAEALQGVRLNTTYLVWKNPRFRGYPDPQIIRSNTQD